MALNPIPHILCFLSLTRAFRFCLSISTSYNFFCKIVYTVINYVIQLNELRCFNKISCACEMFHFLLYMCVLPTLCDCFVHAVKNS